MLLTLVAWIYISFLCWTWGLLLNRIMKKLSGAEPGASDFGITCIAGLSLITVVAGILSLFLPLGNWWIQLIFLLPLFLISSKDLPAKIFQGAKKYITSLYPALIILLVACIVLLLVMSSWSIIHPDTLGYHAQTMQWIEKYKAVPGIVHLHVRFGYQGQWFVDEALFDFSFINIKGTTLLNSAVLCWFFIFIIGKINRAFKESNNKIVGLSWFALLGFSLWSFTQVRLTATSASPDFIAAIFVFTITYLFITKIESFTKAKASDWFLLSFLSTVALTIKLSVVPILLIAALACVIFLITKKIKLLFVTILISLICLFPFFARNIISSGYLVFPAAGIDIINTDWKYSKQLTLDEKNYITAYAKKQGISTKEEIDNINHLKISEWLPGWWTQRSLADKTILVVFLISVLLSLIFIRGILQQGSLPIVLLMILLSGVLFWFVNAPDPRFGFGPIMAFCGLVFYLILKNTEFDYSKNIYIVLFLISCGTVIAYANYRFQNFYEEDQWLKPMGIKDAPFNSFDCDGILINKPLDNNEFGSTPIPCSDLDCSKFSPRIDDISGGFRSTQNP